jgi:prepilin-type N-terminal cleavage/methylation domain-containing protein
MRPCRGFTLVEIIVVVVILGLLAAAVGSAFSGPMEEARVVAVRTNLRRVQGQLELYYAKEHGFPELVQLQRHAAYSYTGSWGLLIDAGYLREAPKNDLEPSKSSLVQGVPTLNAGWHYDEITGRLGATYYDEATENHTPGTP